MSKNTVKDEVMNEVNESVANEAPVAVKKLTLGEKMKASKEARALDKAEHPEKYTFGAKVKRALPFIGTAVAAAAVGFLANAFIKEDDCGCACNEPMDLVEDTPVSEDL